MQDGEQYAGGLALHFYERGALEPTEGLQGREAALAVARNALRILTMGWQNEVKSMVTPKVIKAIFWSRDHELMWAMRVAFQQGFDHLLTQLQGQQFPPLKQRQAEAFISHCLTLLPFSDITPYECFTIPQYVNARWQMVHYKIVPIELTPTTGFKKLFISEKDRVFAYGFEPINHRDASPHLVFMGTTYPAGQGLLSQLNTDLEAFETAGKKLYRHGRAGLLRWLHRQEKKVHVCGTSLGGALSLLLAIDQGDKLSRVDAFNPPGLYTPWLKKSEDDHWDELVNAGKSPKVYVYKQGNDPISKFGAWKEAWDILHVVPSEERKKQLNPLTDHAMIYSGYEDTEFIGVDTKTDNATRKQRNFWLYTLLRSAFYFSVLVPFRYGVLPILRYLWTHKRQVALGCAFFALFILFPVLSPALLIPGPAFVGLIISASLSAGVWAYFTDFIATVLLHDPNQKKPDPMHPVFSRMARQSVVVNVILGTGLMAVPFMMVIIPLVPIFTPLMTPILFLSLAASPLVVALTYFVIDSVKTIQGMNKPTIAQCHDPALPRNPDKDIYRQDMAADMSIQALGDYYYAVRTLLKGKPYLPLSDDDRYRERYDGFSKYEVIEKSQQPEEAIKTIRVKASEAKIHEIKQLGAIARRFGFQKSPACLDALNDVYKDYQLGKANPKKREEKEAPERANQMGNWV